MTETRTQLARGRAQCARRGQALVAALVALTSTPGAAQHQHASTPPDTGVHRRAVVGGVVVDLALTPTAARADGSLVEGEDVTVRLALTDSTGAPLAGLPVAAWVDRRAAGGATTDSVCRLQIQSYLRGSLQFRPTVDLNSHFVVSLNTGNSISVLDPLVSFSVSQVYAGVVLAGEGEDWALAADGRRLFVTLPQVNLVAVVNTETWKVDTNLAVGQRPTRIVAAPDGRSVWVSDEGPRGQAPGVTIIDAGRAAVVRHVATGRGPHDLAFRDDGAAVYVANAGAGSLTAIDAATLAVAATVPTGPRPVAAAFARAGSAVYVGDGVDGSITVVDAGTHAVRARLDAEPGLATLRFDASGRWGFALNATRNEITILDAAAARVSHTVPFGDGPDQVVFTEGFAHVRSSHSTAVAMISLTALAVGDSVHLMPYVAGQYAPDALGGPWAATGMAPASHHDMPDAIYIASPADKSVYQFHYMMGTPMAGGRFNAFPFEPRAVVVVSRSMREREPGVQEATFRAPPAGAYDVVLLVREPRVVRCLGFEVAAAPTRTAAVPTALRVEAVTPGQRPAPGEASTVALRLVDGTTGEPLAGVTDLVAYVTSPTGWSERRPARPVGDGVYEFSVTFPAPGVYYVAVASRSLRTRFDNQVPFALVAGAREGGGPR